MAVDSLVRLDPDAGFAFIGDARIPLEEVGRAGHLRVGGPGGPVLRAPTFGERSRVAWRALSSADPRSALTRGLLRVTVESDGAADEPMLEIITLALAGGGREGPSFVATALDVARASGMDLPALDALDAETVDRLADHLTQPEPSDWQTFVFDTAPRENGSIRDRLADRLLQRAEARHQSGDTAADRAPARFGDPVAPRARGTGDRSLSDRASTGSMPSGSANDAPGMPAASAVESNGRAPREPETRAGRRGLVHDAGSERQIDGRRGVVACCAG